MKQKAKKRKPVLALTLVFSAIVLAVILVTIVLVGVITVFLIYRGALEVGEMKIDAGSFILNLVLLSFGIGAVLALTSSHFPMKSVQKMLSAMERLSSGDYSARLSFRGPLARHPAIGDFVDGFNKMASELEATEMLRSDFINNFSHEFKTPIVSIAGFAKLLRHADVPPEKRNEYLDIIEEESMRLSQMATNVLNLTKVENQAILTDISHFDLSEQLRNCILMLEPKWTKKDVSFDLPGCEFYADGNEELLMQVWINIIDNAVKFAHEGSTVTVDVKTLPGGVSVAVTDEGEEIPAESIDKVFGKFYQADESHSTEGNGVGLAVVKKIVDLHGGEVSAASADGKTTFTVTLPTG